MSKMTDGEKMVWAAAFAAAQVNGMGWKRAHDAADEAVQGYRSARDYCAMLTQEFPMERAAHETSDVESAVTKSVLRVGRDLSGCGPCQGYLKFTDTRDDRTYMSLHCDLPDGVTVGALIEVTIRVIEPGPPETPECKNDWPAHRCPDHKKKKA